MSLVLDHRLLPVSRNLGESNLGDDLYTYVEYNSISYYHTSYYICIQAPNIQVVGYCRSICICTYTRNHKKNLHIYTLLTISTCVVGEKNKHTHTHMYIIYACTLANLIVQHPRRRQGVYSENRKSRGIYLFIFIFRFNPPLPFCFD